MFVNATCPAKPAGRRRKMRKQSPSPFRERAGVREKPANNNPSPVIATLFRPLPEGRCVFRAAIQTLLLCGVFLFGFVPDAESCLVSYRIPPEEIMKNDSYYVGKVEVISMEEMYKPDGRWKERYMEVKLKPIQSYKGAKNVWNNRNTW